MGLYGIIWDYMGLYGIIWDYMGYIWINHLHPLTNWDGHMTFHHFSWVKFSIVPASSTASPASAVLSLPKAMARWRDLSRGNVHFLGKINTDSV